MQIKTEEEFKAWLKENAENDCAEYTLKSNLYVSNCSFLIEFGEKMLDSSEDFEVCVGDKFRHVYKSYVFYGTGFSIRFKDDGRLVFSDKTFNRVEGTEGGIFTTQIERDEYSKQWRQENFNITREQTQNKISHRINKLKKEIERLEEWNEIIETQEYAD